MWSIVPFGKRPKRDRKALSANYKIGDVLNGKVYEMGFYDGNLSLTDRAQLYYYLGIKHNVPGYDGPSELKPYNYPDTGYLP